MIIIKKVTIADIRKATNDKYLDTEYREALANSLINLGYIKLEEQEKLTPSFMLNKGILVYYDENNKELNGNELSEIIHLMMYKMRNDFQYGKFKPVAEKFLKLSDKMREVEQENTKLSETKRKIKYKVKTPCVFIDETLGDASKVLKKNGLFNESREMIERATMCYDYAESMKVIKEYVNLEKEFKNELRYQEEEEME